MIVPRIAIAALAAIILSAAHAASDVVIARNSTATITQSELESELTRLPPEMRAEFLNAPRRVGELITQMLARKTLAQQAQAAGLDKLPENQLRIAADNERILAQLRLAEIESKAAADFDAHKDAYERRAREIYLADRDRFRSPEEVSASHILFSTDKHGSDEAKALAEAARAKLAAGADFATLAKEQSEDPSAARNGGALGYFPRERMDPAFSAAAFALQKPGELSPPVKSSFGWHVIRLDGRHPAGQRSFDEVKPEIMAELRKQYLEEQRDAVLSKIRNDPQNTIDEATLNDMAAKAKASSPAAAAQPRQR